MLNRVNTLLALALFISASVVYPNPAHADSAPVKGPKIGMILPLSGNFAPLGTDARQGIAIARDEKASAVTLDLAFADSKADPAASIMEFKKLVDTDKVAAIFTVRSTVGMALNPLSKADGISLLAGVGHKDFATQNPFAFQIWSRSDDEGAFLAAALIKQKIRKIALLTTQDDWTMAVTEGFRDAYLKLGGTLLLDQNILPAESEYSTIVSQSIAKKPDAIVANVTISQMAPIFRRIREQSKTMPIFSNFFASKKEVVEATGKETIEGLRFIEMDTNLPTFQKRLQEKFGTNPSGMTLSAYVATILLAQTMAENPLAQTPAALFGALEKQTAVHTADGIIPIKERAVEFPLVLRIMHKGRAESVPVAK